MIKFLRLLLVIMGVSFHPVPLKIVYLAVNELVLIFAIHIVVLSVVVMKMQIS